MPAAEAANAAARTRITSSMACARKGEGAEGGGRGTGRVVSGQWTVVSKYGDRLSRVIGFVRLCEGRGARGEGQGVGFEFARSVDRELFVRNPGRGSAEELGSFVAFAGGVNEPCAAHGRASLPASRGQSRARTEPRPSRPATASTGSGWRQPERLLALRPARRQSSSRLPTPLPQLLQDPQERPVARELITPQPLARLAVVEPQLRHPAASGSRRRASTSSSRSSSSATISRSSAWPASGSAGPPLHASLAASRSVHRSSSAGCSSLTRSSKPSGRRGLIASRPGRSS